MVARELYPVSIVGTGPGNTDFLAVRAARVIRSADVVLYDCKTASLALSLADAKATIRYVERPAGGCVPGELSEMLRIVRDFHYEGLRVVRLKVGDPTLFAGEVDECRFLGEMAIPYEIIPGITPAASAAATYAIPTSLKCRTNAVISLIVNSLGEGEAEIRDALRMLRHGATLVLYMVGPNLEKVMHLMIEAEGNPATPVVAVSKSGWPDEAMVSASIGTVAASIAERGLKEPIIYFIGSHIEVRSVRTGSALAFVSGTASGCL
ncbi:SAM-dependent methyltransferase [Chlorobium sp. N1]|uniref:SAM-dependent methyltransferase n=1 Tax=Chlorobium sp. N1 TaxID=2491138 RepID=UPI00103B348F|nr:SAM-dependent methyltransferase [Chlorobium sp. N1]TCD47208.1 uroporphyrinogen-III C-methyltransferase [Chlorobium sp. N1]